MEQLKQLLTAAGIAYKENEPLAAHCTFKIGGPARLFVQPADRAQLCRAVALCKAQSVRYYLLGNGRISCLPTRATMVRYWIFLLCRTLWRCTEHNSPPGRACGSRRCAKRRWNTA